MTTRRRLYFARHGETDWNAEGRWQGHTDVPLNDRGRAQALALAQTAAPLGLAGVVSSDLSRAHETGRIVAERLGVAVAYVDHGLRERTFGVFEGLTREQCAEQHPELWRAWLDERRTPPGAETGEALSARLTAAVGRVAARVATPSAPALIVTHGGALRALVAAVTGESPPPVKNAELWVAVWDAGLVDVRPA